MALNYETTNWENGKTVLKAEHLRKIEKGITDIIAENDAIYTGEDIRKSNEEKRQEEHLRKMNEASEVVSNIQKDYDSLQKIIIDENASVNLQKQINSVNSQLEHKASKADINLEDYEGLNETQKLKNLINDVDLNYKSKKVKIIIPFDIEVTEDIVIDGWDNKNIEFNGEIFFNNCNAIIFKRLNNSKVFINSVRGTNSVSINDVHELDKNGICFSSCAYNDIHINKIYGFKNGLILEGKNYSDNLSNGSFNNKIAFKNIMRVYNGIVLRSVNEGWVNENIISDGSLDCVNGLIQGNAEIEEVTTSNFHNNKFLFLAFEQIRGGTAIQINQGRSNVFLYPRFEGDGNPIPQLIIKEGKGTAFNCYITSGYTLNLEQIELNKSGIARSYVEGDIRSNTGIACNKMKALNNDYVYESDLIGDNSKNNTIAYEYNDRYLFSYKNTKGTVKNVGYYEDVIKVQNESMKNNFRNFASNETSDYPFINYYMTGNNEVCVAGVASGGSSNSVIFTLPVKYRPQKDHIFPIYVKHNLDGNKIDFVNVTSSGNVVFMGDITQVNRIYLDGIRFKIDF